MNHDVSAVAGPRRKIVLYNPRAVFFTMPLALIAIGSELDPEKYEVVIVDGRLDADAARKLRAMSASSPGRAKASLLQHIARLRCERNEFGFPIEMRVMQWLWPSEKLS